MSEADKIIKNLKNSGKKVEEFYVSNKTSDNNVGSIEKISQTSDKNVANDSVIAHKFATMQQQIDKKDKRIQELEEALLKVKDKNTTLFITCRNSIPKQAVIDKIGKLKNEYDKKYDLYMGYKIESREQQDILKQMEILQELLEGESK